MMSMKAMEKIRENEPEAFDTLQGKPCRITSHLLFSVPMLLCVCAVCF